MDYELTEDLINSMLKAAKGAADEGKDSSQYYLLKSIENLYNLALKTGTFGNFNNESDVPIACVRLIRCRRPIHKLYLIEGDKLRDETTGAFERVFCSGLYVALPVIHIPKQFVETKCKIGMGKYSKYTIDVPEINELGVKALESTMRFNSDGSAIVLISSPYTNCLTAGNHYQMLELY